MLCQTRALTHPWQQYTVGSPSPGWPQLCAPAFADRPRALVPGCRSLVVMPMRSGLFLPLFDELADPAGVARLSAEAEEAGWDGVFV